MGARVYGYALAPNPTPSLCKALGVEGLIESSKIADIRNLEALQKSMADFRPDVVIHMAAQPLVRYSYVNPVETYATNVMGTVHVLECTRVIDSVRATVVVTTDKCYENKEWVWGYRENEPMGGHDPYSNSKGCAELVTSAYRHSFFTNSALGNKIASARAGNVIGGGDWSQDRLIPDAMRAFEQNLPLRIRNPLATRPWQHILEPLAGYLMLAEALYEHGSIYASGWNFGPNEQDNCQVQDVINLLISKWGNSAYWEAESVEQPHEAHLLKLDCSKTKASLGWAPKWNLDVAIQKIVDWQKSFLDKENMQVVSLAQIKQYMNHKE